MRASRGSTPEWLATSSAGPSDGTWAKPRILTLNQPRYSARAAGISTARLSSGSNPDSGSTSCSPAALRRTNSAALATRLIHSPANGGPGSLISGSPHRGPAWQPTRRIPATRQARRYFLFLRWTRVLRSSLRCFFFAIRLRRFLITEPTEPPLIDTHVQRRAQLRADALLPD